MARSRWTCVAGAAVLMLPALAAFAIAMVFAGSPQPWVRWCVDWWWGTFLGCFVLSSLALSLCRRLRPA
jgi:hypothetical protein